MNCKRCGSQIESFCSSFCCPHCGTIILQNRSKFDNTADKSLLAWETTEAFTNPLSSLINTLSESFFNTESFFKKVTKGTTIKSAWLFAIITGSFGIFASFIWSFLSFNYTPDKTIPPSSLILTPLIITLQLFAVTFYCLLVFSFLRQNKSSMKSTFRIVAYSQSAMILYAIPFLGSILSPVLWFYMLVTGLHHANSVGKLKTTLILIFPVLFIVFIGIVALSAFLAGNIFANEQLTNFFDLFPG